MKDERRMVQDPGEGVVTSAAEVRALAGGLARQARETYAGLARRMRELGNAGTAAAFEEIGAIAASHHPPSDAALAEDAPRIFNHENMGASRLTTPYEAYALAVRNSEHAFAYWTRISAHAKDREIAAEAERSAMIEMDHMQELRAGRRRAFHEGRRTPLPSSAALRVAKPAESRIELADCEAALADLHQRIADRLAGIRNPWAQILAEIADEERRNAQNYGPPSETAPLHEPLPEEGSALLTRAAERTEAAVEYYFRTAEESHDEELVGVAQFLASEGVGRLARLRDV